MKNHSKRVETAGILGITLTLLLISFIPAASGQSSTKISIIDSTTGSRQIKVGTEGDPVPPEGIPFTINVTVTDVTNLYIWQVVVEYNKTILTAVDATIPLDNVFEGKTYFAPDAEINDTRSPVGNGYVLMGATLLIDEVSVARGVLCQINFIALAEGATEIRIGTQADPIMVPGELAAGTPQWSFFEDMPGKEIPFTAENGAVTVATSDRQPPVANAGGNRTISTGTTYTLLGFSIDFRPLNISFDGTRSTDNIGISSFVWDLGDGTIKNGSRIIHRYSGPDEYIVTLTITDLAGNSDTDTVFVTVTPPKIVTVNPGVVYLIIIAIAVGVVAVVFWKL